MSRILIVLALLAAGSAHSANEFVAPVPRAVWLGQDGHDFCQTATSLKPNDIQDLHIRLEALPEDDGIEGILIRRAGGGEWAFGSKGGRWTWKAHLLRESNAATANLFLEPSHNDQSFRADFELRFRSGREERFALNCGRSNPNLFMSNAVVTAKWVGHDGHDWTGAGPAVGPDGFEDARIEISGLSTKQELKSISLELPESRSWECGLNPARRSNAELMRDPKDRSRGSLFFSPDRNLVGQKLRLCVTYAIERSNATEVVAGPTNARRSMPRPPEIQISQGRYSTEWLGQDGQDRLGRGDLHLVLKGLAPEREIVDAALSDTVGGYWIFRRDDEVNFYPRRSAVEVSSLPLLLHREPRATEADLFFQPYRDEAGTRMVLRLLLDDGTTTVHQFTGSNCDPYRRGPLPRAKFFESLSGWDWKGNIRARHGPDFLLP